MNTLQRLEELREINKNRMWTPEEIAEYKALRKEDKIGPKVKKEIAKRIERAEILAQAREIMGQGKIQETNLQCLRCGHKWLSRVDKPLKCPHCTSILWNKERKENDNQSLRTLLR